MLRLREITKTYIMGDVTVHALRGVDLDIQDGELVRATGASAQAARMTTAIVAAVSAVLERRLEVKS